jgi:hypothetical protein
MKRRSTKAQATQPLPKQPPPTNAAAPRATAQAQAPVSPRDEALRQQARTVADRYISRDGKILISRQS